LETVTKKTTYSYNAVRTITVNYPHAATCCYYRHLLKHRQAIS